MSLQKIIANSYFSCGATLHVTLSVCLPVCLFFIFYMKYLSLFEYQEYSRIFKEREIYIKNRQTANKHTDVRN